MYIVFVKKQRNFEQNQLLYVRIRPLFSLETFLSEYKLFTSESVSEGHPDKVADQISDAVLDAMLRVPFRVACETLVKDSSCFVRRDYKHFTARPEAVAKKVILDIGYNDQI